MTKQILALAVLCIGAAFVLTTSAHAGEVVATLGSWDSPDSYDFETSFPPTTYQSIGTFTFTIPAGATAASVTISGSFGNGDSGTTALSDYYLGFAGDEEAVEVAACDNILADCYSATEGPTTWTATLTQAEISVLATALANGSIDFGYTWDSVDFRWSGVNQNEASNKHGIILPSEIPGRRVGSLTLMIIRELQ
jgi:hypothetical protein